MSTDRIGKKILLRAPRKRIWHALSDSTEFGTWFGMKFDGPFCARRRRARCHRRHQGQRGGRQCSEGIRRHVGRDHHRTDRAQRLFSFRWHPFAVERGVDYSAEPTTLIVFTLEETPDGVLLTVTESDSIKSRSNADQKHHGKRTGLDDGIETNRGVPCPNIVALESCDAKRLCGTIRGLG